MIESLILILLAVLGIGAAVWLFFTVLGLVLNLIVCLVLGVLGIIGGASLLALLLPLGVGVALIALPILGLVLLPALLPLLLIGALLWWWLKPGTSQWAT